MRTILVTGSEGNIGQYIVLKLRSIYPKWKVIRIKHKSSAPVFNSTNERYEGDLRDDRLLKLIFEQNAVDYVLHAASTSYSHLGYKQHPYKVFENDCLALLGLLRYSSNVRKIIYLSSALAYEHATSSPLLEDASLEIPSPSSSFGAAKYFGENAVKFFHAEHGVKFTIWRPFNVVSPLEPHDGEGRHVFVDFFRKLIVEKVPQFKIMGSGNQIRCFIWVDEVADCIVSSIEKPESDNEIFNLARNEPISLLGLKDLFLELGKELGAIPKDYEPITEKTGTFAGVESEIRVPSVAKIKKRLEWESSVPVRDCFRNFIKDKLHKL